MNVCSTTDCDTDAGDLYLCQQCISDLDQWLEKGRTIVPEMGVTIARLDNVRPTNNEGNNGTKSAGSAAPLNIGALELQMSLEDDLRFTAAEYAADPYSATDAPRVIEDIKKAELLVSGPEGDAPTQDRLIRAAVEIRELVPEHMSGPDLSLWLKNVHKMTVYPFLIRKWAQRGHITRTNSDGRPTYSPAAVLVYARKDLLQKQKKVRKV